MQAACNGDHQLCNSFQIIINISSPELSSGFDIYESSIESTFGTCDENSDGQINPNEIHNENCVGTLDTMFGLTESQLPELFHQIDTNADMKISSEEALTAFHRIEAFNRKGDDGWWSDNYGFSTGDASEAENIARTCYNDIGSYKGRIECVRDEMLNSIDSIENWRLAVCANSRHGKTFPRMFTTIYAVYHGGYKQIYMKSNNGKYDLVCYFFK